MKSIRDGFWDHTVSSLLSCKVTDIADSLNVSPGDSVIAATPFHVQLSATSTQALGRKLCEWFPSNCIVINSVVFLNPLATMPIPQATEPQILSGPCSTLVYWVRLQGNIEDKGFNLTELRSLDDSNNLDRNSLIALSGILFKLGLGRQLFHHVVDGMFFGHTPVQVFRFFSALKHGFSTVQLHSSIESTETDFVASMIPTDPYPTDLKCYAIKCFQKYAETFKHLLLSYVLDRDYGPRVLTFDDSKSSWSNDSFSIDWTGSNWILHDVRLKKIIARQRLSIYKWQCIPCLGCVQSAGEWTVLASGISDITVIVATSEHVQAHCRTCVTSTSSTDHTLPATSTAVSPKKQPVARFTGSPFKAFNSGAAFNPTSFIALNFDFFGWDPVLNSIAHLAAWPSAHNASSPLRSALKVLLERCLRLWQVRNGDSNEKCEKFFSDAICSLETTGGRESVPDSTIFKRVFNKYGCFQTPRLWSTTERLMLMVACVWPSAKYLNIDQKNNDTTFMLRGMSIMHPGVSRFMRQRIIDFEFINDTDFPPEYAVHSFVTICSNACGSALHTHEYSNLFVFCRESDFPFLALSNSSNLEKRSADDEINADAVYARTKTGYNGCVVYAIVNDVTATNFLGPSASKLKLFPDVLCLHPTVLLVKFDDSQRSSFTLEAVTYAFAMHMQQQNVALIRRKESGTYERFFTVLPASSTVKFAYVPVSKNPLIEVPRNIDAIISSMIPNVDIVFNFGSEIASHYEPPLAKGNFGSLTDQCKHFDGSHQPLPWHSEMASILADDGRTVSTYGVDSTIMKKVVCPFHQTQRDVTQTSNSTVYAVFPNTFIGVKIGRRWYRVKISDSCAFFFSFWLEHFGVGLEKFLWHWRPHGYNHSADIRHFPVASPEQLFVIFAAAKLATDPVFPTSVSSAGFEALMLDALATHRDRSISREATPFFNSLSMDLVKKEAVKFYEFLDIVQWDNASAERESQSDDDGEKDHSDSSVSADTDCAGVQVVDVVPSSSVDTQLSIDDDQYCSSRIASSPKAIADDDTASASLSRIQPKTFGLPNIGSSCYMNASLQCLLHTAELSHLFLGHGFDGSSLQPTNIDDPNVVIENQEVANSFKKFVNYSGTDDIKRMLGELHSLISKGFAKRDKQYEGKTADSSECFYYLVERICPSMFRLTIESELKCLTCSTRSSTLEREFVVMPFPATRHGVAATFAECLNLYLVPEFMCIPNQPHCSNCNHNRDSSKQLFIKELPDFVYIGLKRFETTPAVSEGNFFSTAYRVNRMMAVPVEYDFGAHYQRNRRDVFRLYAAVCHIPGGVGHYTAYCQPNPGVSWLYCNDASVTPCTEMVMLDGIKRNGYFFFFRRQALNVKRLSQDVLVCRTLEDGNSLLGQLNSIYSSSSVDKTVDCTELLASQCDTSDQSCIAQKQQQQQQQYSLTNVAPRISVSSPGAAVAPASSPGAAASLLVTKNTFPVIPRKRFYPELPNLPNQPATSSSSLMFTGLVSLAPGHVEALNAFRTQMKFDASIPSYTPRFEPPESVCRGQSVVHVARCRTVFVQYPRMFISDEPIDWFFMALTALFPAYMYLPCTLLQFRRDEGYFNSQKAFLANWKANFFHRCPIAVLLTVNYPADISQPASTSNSPRHWGLFAIECVWNRDKSLEQVSCAGLESFADDMYTTGARDWIETAIFPIFEVKNAKFQEIQFPKLQHGHRNNHCGVYCMALGLNYVMGTLLTMKSRLLPQGIQEDTSAVGLELRKMAAWDSLQDPPLLDACLCMCPLFKPISSFEVECNAWWSCLPSYDLCKSLNFVLRSQDRFVMSGWNGGTKQGSRFVKDEQFTFSLASICNKGKVSTDGPFFFSNAQYFVKVHCIGLLGRFQQDRISLKRAAQGFQESAASMHVCYEHKWFCQTFGLVCMGLSNPCVFVCIARSKLQCPAPNVDVKVGCEVFSNLATKSSKPVLHGDPYEQNMGAMQIPGQRIQLQAHDLERAFLVDLAKVSFRQIEIFTRLYYTSLNTVLMEKLIMPQVQASGLDATNQHFTAIYRGGQFLSQSFGREAFEQSPVTRWRYCAWLHLMELLTDSGLSFDQSTDLFVIKFQLKEHVRIGGAAAEYFDCELQFSTSKNDGQIQIIRCTRHSVVNASDVAQPSENVLTGRSICLTDERATLNFFDEVKVIFLPQISSESDSEIPEVATEQVDARLRKVASHGNSSKRRKAQHESSNSQVDSERNSALTRQFRFLANKMVSNDVWRNCVSSIRIRFPDYNPPYYNPPVQFNNSSYTNNLLHFTHLECRIVVVGPDTENQCLEFIKIHSVLSIDTETAYPRFPEQGASISLIQLGTNQTVFLIQVAKVGANFFSSLKAALGGDKRLVHWGGSDKSAVASKLGGNCSAEWYDLQAHLSPSKSKLVGLDVSMESYLKHSYSLSKEWTMSGWDLQTLDPRQIAYAALDVCSCHVLYLHHVLHLDTFKSESSKFHSFFTPISYEKGAKLVKHGVSFEQNCCCHYVRGELIQGLFAQMSSNICTGVTPRGFKSINWSENSDIHDPVSKFVTMLNSKKFCCRTCSDLEWFKAIDFSHQEFRVARDLSRFSFSRGRSFYDVQVQVPSNIGSRNFMHQAYFCLSMLGSFLNKKLGAIDCVRLVDSVLCDCRYGFICSTLSYFETE